MKKKILPIGSDNFRVIREQGKYYIDKTLMVKDFIEFGEEVTLITRPRRFGKTLNMTMLREFFDITKDSRDIFEGLDIMDTEYALQINSRPVIYISLKDCKADTAGSLLFKIKELVLKEYSKYHRVFKGNADETDTISRRFFALYEKLFSDKIERQFLEISLSLLEEVLTEYYKITPVVLIDEYDQPIVSSYEFGYHDELKTFFSGLYGSALKGQDCLHQALLTGIQRVVKESIFSQLNNVRTYTVVSNYYSNYFGFTEEETEKLLADYDLTLNEDVKQQYNGYLFGRTEVYNPWSILNYARDNELNSYWINTSTNALIRESLNNADKLFKKNFDELIINGEVRVRANLECSIAELKSNEALWGLFINAGYATVTGKFGSVIYRIRIPNGEVREEFMSIIAEQANISVVGLQEMFQCLFERDTDSFMKIYSELVITCTSHFDAQENAYHMLFLGMCISLNKLYKITSNIEAGHGRSDICMESLTNGRPHIIIEFKQGEDIEKLKSEALQQILDRKYYNGLNGEVLCIGIAHNKKKCSLAYKYLDITHKIR